MPGVSRWRLKDCARELRPQLIAYAKMNDLPLLIHGSYFSWYKTHFYRAELYNPCVNSAALFYENRAYDPLYIPSLKAVKNIG